MFCSVLLLFICTLQGPSLNQLGLVIHTDMSPLDFYGSRCQVVGHVTIVENLLSLASLFMDTLQEEVGYLSLSIIMFS